MFAWMSVTFLSIEITAQQMIDICTFKGRSSQINLITKSKWSQRYSNFYCRVYTCQCIRSNLLSRNLRSRASKDLDENWQANVPYQYACVQKLTLLDADICSRYIIVYCVTRCTQECKNERTCDLPAYTVRTSCERCNYKIHYWRKICLLLIC